jgi:hypothetical protein
MHKGTVYVSLPALADALGASVVSQGRMAVLSIPPAESACGETPDAMQLSDNYRKAATRIPDLIESLEKVAEKQGVLIPAAKFEEIDRQISEADYRANSDADKSVSYALSHANSALAIMYYKLRRGVSPEFAKQGQMDLELCTLESKYALTIGHLRCDESCSVLQSSRKKTETNAAATTGN